MSSIRMPENVVSWRRWLLSSSALVAASMAGITSGQAQSVVINDARVTTQNLDALLAPGDPPTALVTSTGSVIVPTINGSAITAAAQAWTLTNNGLLSADGMTVKFGLGGTISNSGIINTTAAMQPGLTAVQIDGAFGSVTNSGTITGGNLRGVEMTKGGIVVNQAGGSISAFGGGINITGGTATVTNSGTVASSSFNGISLGSGGTVTNNSGGIVSGGASAVLVQGGAGTVTNSGTMTGKNTVILNVGGIFINNAGGVVVDSSQNNAVSIVVQPGTVDNAGRITGTIAGGFATGVSVKGTLTNRASGLIEGNYNGVWMVNGAAPTLTNAGTIRSVTQDAVEIDATDANVNNSGTITTASNKAGIWMQKAGTITNSGTINSTGGLAINFSGSNFANTLILQTGSVLNGNVQAGAGAAVDALIFNGTGTENANKFLAFETLEMNGTDWTLTGASTFSTSSQITAGTLRINGNLTTPTMTVLSGGTLAGGGTVTGNVVASTGRVAPGSAVTTLHIGGNLMMGASSTFHVDLDPTSASLVRVSGPATLSGGQIDVAFTPGSYTNGMTYTVLHSDTSVAGNFANDTVAVGAFRFNVTYDPDDVFLTLLRIAFDDVCASHNQCAVGGSIERLGPVIPGDLGSVVDTLAMLDIPGQQRALASLAGDMHPTLALLALDGHALFGQSVTRRLADKRTASQQSASTSDGGYEVAMLGRHDGLMAANIDGGAPGAMYGAWLRGYGAVGTLHGDINAAGANYFVGGAAFGLDRQFAPGFNAGLSFGYANTKADFNGANTSGRIDSYDIGLYGSYQTGGFHLDAVASYAFLDNKTDRQIVVGDIRRNANASYSGQRYGVALEAGYDLRFNSVTIAPLLAMNYVHLRQNGFHEDGAGGLDLDGKRSSADSLRGAAGLRLGTQFGLGGAMIGPELRGRVEHEFLDNRLSTDVNFAGQPAAGAFTVVGAKLPRNSAIVGGGITAAFTPWTSAFVDYDYKFNKDQKIHNMTAGVRFEF